MLRKLPIGLIALSLVSTLAFAGSNSGSGSGPVGTSYNSGSGSASGSNPSSGWGSGSNSGSKSGSGWGSGSRDEEFNYYRIDCRYHGDDQDDRGSHHGSDWGSDHGSDHTGNKMGDRLSDKMGTGEKGKVYGDSNHDGRFCYGSAVYRITDREVRDIHLAIGCDNRTIFNEDARLHTEATLDRLQPLRAATPAIEVFPHGQLGTEGTYTSVLDISYGRMKGLCYVHPVKYDSIARKY